MDYHSLQNSNSKLLKLERKNEKLNQKNQELIKRKQLLGTKFWHFRNQKSKHIAESHYLVWQSKQITKNEFRKQVNLVFKSGKQNYTPDAICFATEISQVGQMLLCSTVECIQLVYEYLTGEQPRNWLVTSTLCTWHQEISNLQFNKQILQLKNAQHLA